MNGSRWVCSILALVMFCAMLFLLGVFKAGSGLHPQNAVLVLGSCAVLATLSAIARVTRCTGDQIVILFIAVGAFTVGTFRVINTTRWGDAFYELVCRRGDWSACAMLSRRAETRHDRRVSICSPLSEPCHSGVESACARMRAVGCVSR